MIAPAKTQITLKYGAYDVAGYTQTNPHAGVDFSHSPDNGIYAPESGQITARSYMGDCGEAAELSSGSNLHRFCHASQWLVKLGERVTQGQKIGVMGQTGRAFGVHLHWILWVNGTRVNGENYINEEGEEPMKAGDVENLIPVLLLRRATAADHQFASGKTYQDWIYAIVGSAEYKAIVNDLLNWKNTAIELSQSDVNKKLDQIKQIVNS